MAGAGAGSTRSQGPAALGAARVLPAGRASAARKRRSPGDPPWGSARLRAPGPSAGAGTGFHAPRALVGRPRPPRAALDGAEPAGAGGRRAGGPGPGPGSGAVGARAPGVHHGAWRSAPGAGPGRPGAGGGASLRRAAGRASVSLRSSGAVAGFHAPGAPAVRRVNLQSVRGGTRGFLTKSEFLGEKERTDPNRATAAGFPLRLALWAAPASPHSSRRFQGVLPAERLCGAHAVAVITVISGTGVSVSQEGGKILSGFIAGTRRAQEQKWLTVWEQKRIIKGKGFCQKEVLFAVSAVRRPTCECVEITEPSICYRPGSRFSLYM
ncbi:uncharacterized protein [Vulpes vulpes]|uniref:Uncharacterized protein isoform X2 n=1 Tax=Vulpes vulpes TaxID=9627 RepID=A0ABM4ZRT6_VULVU